MANQNKLASDLRDACMNCDLRQVKGLLLCGANPCRVIEGEGWAAIHTAVGSKINNCTDYLEAIISSGRVSNIDVGGGGQNITPLLNACRVGNVNCARMLVANGANFKAKSKIGGGVIHCAVLSGKLEMVAECLKWDGVHINQRGNWNRTALIYACEQGCVDIVSFLLSAGADITLKDDNGNTALWFGKDNKEITNLFLNHQRKPTECASGPSALPDAFGTLSLSSGTSNKSSIINIIRRTFPDFTEVKIKSILAAIEDKGYDFKTNNLKHLAYLKESDFGSALKPLEARILLIAFKNESELEGRVVLDF